MRRENHGRGEKLDAAHRSFGGVRVQRCRVWVETKWMA
jgi:hypothetical protein